MLCPKGLFDRKALERVLEILKTEFCDFVSNQDAELIIVKKNNCCHTPDKKIRTNINNRK